MDINEWGYWEMSEIRTKPTSREYRDNFDRVFRNSRRTVCVSVPVEPEPIKVDEKVIVIKTTEGDLEL
jgi:hypothetical protein